MNLQGYQRLSVASLCLVMLLGGLPGCAEKESEKRAREAREEQERKSELVKKRLAEQEEANRKAYSNRTPEQQAIVRKRLEDFSETYWKEALEKKRVAIAVAQGKQPAPTASPPPEIVTRPSEVVNGACPVYDNLKTGTRFMVTPELSGKYGLPEGWYTLDQSCRPVVLAESLQRQGEKKKEADRCGAPFHGFYVGDGIRIEKDEQQFFGYPPGLYSLGDYCRPALFGGKEQMPASVRTEAYKEADGRVSPLQDAYFKTLAARKKKAEEEGRLEAAPPKNCPAPYQAFGPGQIVLVNKADNSSKLIPVGKWWFDIDCKPQWYAPVVVEEPVDRVIDKDRNKWNEILGVGMVVIGAALVLLLLLHRVTMRMTGRGLIEWLRSGGKRE